MISITKSQVSPYLRNSEFYHSLDEDGGEIQIPKSCFKTGLTLFDTNDLRHMLSTLRFWGLATIPSELVRFFILNNINDSDEVFAEFEGELVYLAFLRQLSNFPATRAGQCDYRTYVYGLERSKWDSDPLENCAKLCCLQYEYTNGVTWNAETCELAAEYGNLSMLQWLHDHGCPWDAGTCEKAASKGKLDMLRYAHESDCPWLLSTCSAAAQSGDLECLTYAHEKGCPWDVNTCMKALSNRSSGCFEYAREQGCPWGAGVCTQAARNNDLASLKQLHEAGCPWDSSTCIAAATHYSLTCLKYAHENGCPWEIEVCHSAARAGNLECLKYAHEHGCPWDAQTCAETVQFSFPCLKYAHENGCPWDEVTCAKAARSYNLRALIYAHVNGCPWDASTTIAAAICGRQDILRYAHEHGCPWGTETSARAAGSGSMNCLMYCHENGCPWDATTCAAAASSYSIPDVLLEYAHEHGCVWDAATCANAAAMGHLHCLKYAHENGCPWDSNTCTSATKGGHLDCLIYAHEYGCPIDGELFAYAGTAAARRCIEYAKRHKCIPRLCVDPMSFSPWRTQDGTDDTVYTLCYFTVLPTPGLQYRCMVDDVAGLALANLKVPVLLPIVDFAQPAYTATLAAEVTTLQFDSSDSTHRGYGRHEFANGAAAYMLRPLHPASSAPTARAHPQQPLSLMKARGTEDVIAALDAVLGAAHQIPREELPPKEVTSTVPCEQPATSDQESASMFIDVAADISPQSTTTIDSGGAWVPVLGRKYRSRQLPAQGAFRISKSKRSTSEQPADRKRSEYSSGTIVLKRAHGHLAVTNTAALPRTTAHTAVLLPSTPELTAAEGSGPPLPAAWTQPLTDVAPAQRTRTVSAEKDARGVDDGNWVQVRKQRRKSSRGKQDFA